MFVLTVDQVDSRRHQDGVPAVLARLRDRLGDRLVRAPQRTAGDEFQLLLADAAGALDACLFLTRDGGWSVGCGIGPVDTPLPTDVRAGSGGAYVAARRAVEAAKKSVTRCVVESGVGSGVGPGDDVGPLLDLLLSLRARRSAEGWEVYDLLDRGQLTQRKVAERLGISDQAVSARIRTAEIRLEQAAVAPLVRLFAAADGAVRP